MRQRHRNESHIRPGKRHIRRLDCRIAAGHAHGNPHGRRRQRRRIIDTIPNHGGGGLIDELRNDPGLIRRQLPRPHPIRRNTRLRGDRLSGHLLVAGEHDRPHALIRQCLDRGRGLRAQLIPNPQDTRRRPVDLYHDHAHAGLGHLRHPVGQPTSPIRGNPPGAAYPNTFSLYHANETPTRLFLHLVRCQGDIGVVGAGFGGRGHDRPRQRVRRRRLHRRSHGQGIVDHKVGGNNPWVVLGQRASLVKGHRLNRA